MCSRFVKRSPTASIPPGSKPPRREVAIPRRRGGVRTIALTGSLLALAGAAATANAAGRIEPALAERLDAGPTDRVPVLVTMRGEVRANGRSRPALIRALRRTAARTQRRAAARANAPVERFWLVNAFATRATRGEVRAIAADPSVRSVRLDRAVGERTPRRGRIAAGAEAVGGPWGIDAIDVPAARRLGATGAGVRVGVIDTGVDASHPALAGKIVAWRDFVGGRPAPYDDNGHGTHTLGTIVGEAPIGVAPGATAVVAKAMGADGVGRGSDLLAAAEWMTDPDGDPATADQPAIVNNSWTAGGPTDPWFSDIVRRWLDLGMLPVFAAGNNGPGRSSIGSPASYPDALAVGAVDQAGSPAGFSARGPVTWSGTGDGRTAELVKPDLVAPGVGIASSAGGGIVSYTGTSMAAPHVSGAAALAVQANPSVRGAALADLLRRTARDVGTGGPDPDTGYGVVDAGAALAAVGDPLPETDLVHRPPAATRAKQVLFGVAVERASSYRYRVDDGEWSEPASDPRLRVPLAQGRHVVEIAAQRADGLMDPTPARHVVDIDRRKPTARFTWRARRGTLQLVARGRDAGSGLATTSYSWDLRGRARVGGTRAELRLLPSRTGTVRARLVGRTSAGGKKGTSTGGKKVFRALSRTRATRRGVVVRLRVRDKAGNVTVVTRRVPPRLLRASA